jgi:hypothetical protein
MMTVKIDAPGVTSSNYTFQWSLTGGGAPFASWSVCPATSLAPVPFTTPGTDSLSLSCLFSQAGTVVVSCTVTPIGNNPPVTLSNNPLAVTVTAPGGSYISETTMASDALLQQVPGNNNDTIADVSLVALNGPGIVMSGSGTNPSNFTGGGWDYWQTVDSASCLQCVGGPPTQFEHSSTNGSVVLDTSLPYCGGTLKLQGNVSGNPLAAFPADGSNGPFDDSPGVSDIDSAYYNEILVYSYAGTPTLLGNTEPYGEVYDTYQMYCPPDTGLGTCFVPLKVVEWTWMACATCNTAVPPVWTLSSSSDWVMGSLTFPPFSDWPTWTQNVQSGTWVSGLY